jgi:repressor LexA
MKLSEIVRRYRKSHGLSMQDMATLCGRSKPYIHQLENGNPKTGEEIKPTLETLKMLAKAMNIKIDELVRMIDGDTVIELKPRKGVQIPILGRVVAGVPIEATENILGYEEITEHMACTGEYFALRIKGDSMFPNICNGDTVIVKKQETVESGDIAIVLINGNEATVKKVKFNSNGITLIGFNLSVYEPHFYTSDEISKYPVTIIGKVVELRRKI